MKRINFKRDWKKLLGVVLIVAAVVGIAGALISNDRKDMVSISSSEFEVGSINALTGEHEEDVQSLYTSKAFNCQGLRIAPEFEFTGTYDVFYYDYNEHFIEAKLGLKGVYDEDYPVAKLARVVLHPSIPADETESSFEISWWEESSFASLVDVSVSKNQNWIYQTVNLYNKDNVQKCKDLSTFEVGEAYTVIDSAEISGSNNRVPIHLTDAINIGEYTKFDLYYRYDVQYSGNSIGIVATNNNIITAKEISKASDARPGDWVKVTLSVPKDTNSTHIRVRLPGDIDCYVYGYN